MRVQVRARYNHCVPSFPRKRGSIVAFCARAIWVPARAAVTARPSRPERKWAVPVFPPTRH